MTSGIHEFESDITKNALKGGLPLTESDLRHEVRRFCDEILPEIDEDLADKVIEKLNFLGYFRSDSEDLVYDENFDLKVEIAAQISAVRAMRKTVLLSTGRVKEGVSPRELKEVVTSSSQLIATLMKYHEKLMTMDRYRAVEATTLEILQDLSEGEDLTEKFLTLLEARLSKC